jgi:hypothetical protein
MSENEVTDQESGTRPVRYPAIVPAVAFGLRAAALAGLVISAGATAAGLGIFDSPDALATWPTSSTCCLTTQ